MSLVLAKSIEPLSFVGHVRNDFRTVFVQIPFLKNGLKNIVKRDCLFPLPVEEKGGTPSKTSSFYVFS